MKELPAPIPVVGLFETHLTVHDLQRSIRFYREVVGLALAREVPEQGAAFLWIGCGKHSMLGLWETGSPPLGLRLHLAYETTLGDVLAAPQRLRAHGVTPLSFAGEETSEPSVIGWMPAAAVYFSDPDGHLLEYLALLAEEPRPSLGVVPYSEWTVRAPIEGTNRRCRW
jgi:lactoylglutathione lyase